MQFTDDVDEALAILEEDGEVEVPDDIVDDIEEDGSFDLVITEGGDGDVILTVV